MGLLFDVAAYSALRTRGNIKVARETALMHELGVFKYDEYKAEQRQAKRDRANSNFGWLCLIILSIVLFPIAIPCWMLYGIFSLCRSGAAEDIGQ